MARFGNIVDRPICRCLIAGVLILLCFPSWLFGTQSYAKDCKAIADSQERLHCYDKQSAGTLMPPTPTTIPKQLPMFRIQHLRYDVDGKTLSEHVSRNFIRTPSGRITSDLVTLCRQAPALFEERKTVPLSEEPKTKFVYVRHTYDRTPQSGRFKCASIERFNGEVEFKTSLSVAGDVYTFESEFEVREDQDSYNTDKAKQEAVIQIFGDGEDDCKVLSFRQEEIRTSKGHDGKRKLQTKLMTANARTICWQ